METHVDEDAIRKLAQKIAKDVKTEADLGDFSKLLIKIVVETALDAELTGLRRWSAQWSLASTGG